MSGPLPSDNSPVDLITGANSTPSDVASDVYKHGLHYEKPHLSAKWQELERETSKTLSANAWGYLHNNAGSGESYNANRRLTGQSGPPDLSVALFGKKYPYPIAIAPVGVQQIFNPSGEVLTASAAASEHVPLCMSTASATSIEDVAKANGSGERWFQLYWPDMDHNEITLSMLSRAEASGFDVLVVNVDTFVVGWRPGDLDNGYSPFLRPDHIGVEVGMTDPVFCKIFRDKTGKEVEEDLGAASADWAKIFLPGKPHSWEDLAFLRTHWKGPIVVKGIQSAEDAKRCVQYGMDGVYVSNHGGRQVDGGIGSLDVLAEVVEAVGHQTEIIFDSGVRTGTDVMKALALGAKMVCIGRPWVYGLALRGEEGVRHVIRTILGDLDSTLYLTGLRSVQSGELRECLRRAERV